MNKFRFNFLFFASLAFPLPSSHLYCMTYRVRIGLASSTVGGHPRRSDALPPEDIGGVDGVPAVVHHHHARAGVGGLRHLGEEV